MYWLREYILFLFKSEWFNLTNYIHDGSISAFNNSYNTFAKFYFAEISF